LLLTPGQASIQPASKADMTVNWNIARRRPALESRAIIIQTIRQYFIQKGFLEVETPLRIPAPAPEANIEAIPSLEWFLQTSPELCMKRLLASEFELIFQICHCWRKGERGQRHIPEFTILEWYRANAGYSMLMHDCESLINNIANALSRNSKIIFQGNEITLTPPWERLTVRNAFERFGGCSMDEALESDMFDEIMVDLIEPSLGISSPTFLLDYPAERAALARLKDNDLTVAERFELYIGGIELANGFSELTDTNEQRTRFTLEEQFRRSNGQIPYPEPTKFLEELHTMPPSAGIALGIDRFVMVMLDTINIDDVVAFTPEDL